MDAYEATRIVLSRIQKLDPENASKIMGLLLIQDHGEKEMIRLAFGPEALLQSVILKARKDLGVSSNSPHIPSPSPFLSNTSASIARQNSAAKFPPPLTIPNPSSSPANWAALSDIHSPDAMNSSSLPLYGNLQDQLSFLNDGSPTQPDNWGGSVHRRSCSVSDVCLYFARGYCKNGASCKFVHGAEADAEMMEQDLLTSKSAHNRTLAAASQLMASAFPYSPKSLNLNLNLLLQQQNDSQRTAAALMAGEDLQKFRLERSDFSCNGGLGLINPASRQIYLTFPADSTFREEDVSNYFNIYGPVQDVRIPYQQKRMFGFVTFVYPETVKLILAKGNPHFVCDARVLVKPYKEKGKVPDKYRKQPHQQMERGDYYSPCGTPTGLDSRDLYDLQSPGGGASMFHNNAQDLLWRRKLEEQALELQSRRLMGLQLLDIKKHHHHRALSTGSPVPSPTHSPSLFSPNQRVHHTSFHGNQQVLEGDICVGVENCSGVIGTAANQPSQLTVKRNAEMEVSNGNEANDIGSGKESPVGENNNLLESLEHNLPDSPFASPTKAVGNYFSAFSSNGSSEGGDKDSCNINLVTSTTSLEMASFKAFNCQIPRFSSGHGAIGVLAGSGGLTYPVGI